MNKLKEVCKIGQGSPCCRYLLLGSSGFECAKMSEGYKELIDRNWNETKSAQGDNCDGLNSNELKNE